MNHGQIIADYERINFSADALERLDQLRELRSLIDYYIDEAVEECRDSAEPISWRRIGEALGVPGNVARARRPISLR